MKTLSTLILVLTLISSAQAARFPKAGKKALQGNTNVVSKFNYYGGPVISHAKIYTVLWGAKIDASIKSEMPTFYAGLVDSTYMDWLKEYDTNKNAIDGRQGTGQTIGRGSYGGTITISPSVAAMAQTKTGVLADAMIQAELESQILAGKLPTPTADTLYMIHFPSGVKVTIDDGSGGTATSCQAFCAFHEGFKTKAGLSVYYGVIPDLSSMACAMGCGGGTLLTRTTISASHEVIEAVSDAFPTPGSKPAFPQAWNTADGMEIGDVCQSALGKLSVGAKTYTVQHEYSQARNGCMSGNYTH